jgi:hypothetical protein
MCLPCFLFDPNQSTWYQNKGHGVQRVVLEGFMILGLCMVRTHMNFFKDIVWSRSLVHVFNFVQALSGVWSSLVI